jgi:phosphate starvation-inducible protein PhoH
LNDTTSKDLLLETSEYIPDIFGTQDLNLKQIEKKFNVRITTRETRSKSMANRGKSKPSSVCSCNCRK